MILSSSFEYVQSLGFKGDLAESLAARLAGVKGAPNVTKLKKMAPGREEEVDSLVKAQDLVIKKIINPLVSVVNDFANRVLNSIKPILHADVSRIQRRLPVAIDRIKGIPAVSSELQRHTDLVGDISKIPPIEGIVFFYKGQPYKFTGQFASVNQVMNLFRKSVKDHGVRGDLPESLLREGGHAFSDVEPIELKTLKAEWERLQEYLRSFGASDIEPIGTTFKKPVMGDIDIACSHPEGREGVHAMAVSLLGAENVRRISGNIVSFAWPLQNGRKVQVDLMIGNTNLLKWSRFGPHPTKGNIGHSVLKGSVRSLLFRSVLRAVSGREFPGQQGELDRVRYSFDLDNGLFKKLETRRGAVDKKTGVQRPLKTWKTVSKELISDDPDEIVSILFGEGPKAVDVLTFEDIVRELQATPALAPFYQEIVDTFLEELESDIETEPFTYGKTQQDARAVIPTVKRILGVV
jgi:hypothetical protein